MHTSVLICDVSELANGLSQNIWSGFIGDSDSLLRCIRRSAFAPILTSTRHDGGGCAVAVCREHELARNLLPRWRKHFLECAKSLRRKNYCIDVVVGGFIHASEKKSHLMFHFSLISLNNLRALREGLRGGKLTPCNDLISWRGRKELSSFKSWINKSAKCVHKKLIRNIRT